MSITFYEVIIGLGRKGRESATAKERFEDVITFCNFLQELDVYIRFEGEKDSRPADSDEMIDCIANKLCYVRYRNKEFMSIHPKRIRIVIGESRNSENGACFRQVIAFSRFDEDAETFFEACGYKGATDVKTERLSFQEYMILVLNNYYEDDSKSNSGLVQVVI